MSGSSGGLGNIARATAGFVSMGTSELLQKHPFGTGMNNPFGVFGGGGSGGSGIATASGVDPLQLLSQTGGAPLLTQIASGASVKDALASYFGQNSAGFDSWLASQPKETQDAINGVSNQLTQIQSNTDLKNQVVQKLVNDFPNYMAKAIPQYSSLADDATKQMMDQALKDNAAKYAAGGMVSSGAETAAAARAGAGIAMDKLTYGTSLANQDWMQQYTEANALRNFQQKMLGQGATQGFSAYQSMLGLNANASQFNADATNKKNIADQNSENQLLGSLGGLAGTALGAYIGGPAGAAVGGKVGSSAGGGASDYGFSGPATPGYSRNNNPADYGINSGGGYR